MTNILRSGAAILAMAAAFAGTPAIAADPAGVKNIVLVHGAWADGSGWRGVHDLLAAKGYSVTIVQNPLTSLADDVAAVDRVLALQTGSVILVGHSYGGAVITEAGDDAKVAGLVYVAAFAPDVGESTFGLLKDGPQPPITVTADGFAFFNKGAYEAAFAPDVGSAEASAFMHASQVPISVHDAGMAPMTVAAWKTKPSWYAVSTDDMIIPPDAERKMAARAGSTVVEVKGSHVAFVHSQTEAIAKLIEQAATTAVVAVD